MKREQTSHHVATSPRHAQTHQQLWCEEATCSAREVIARLGDVDEPEASGCIEGKESTTGNWSCQDGSVTKRNS